MSYRQTKLNVYVHYPLPKRVKTKSKALEKQKILAEKWNGRLAMIGLVAAAASDLLTGHMFFGIF